MSQGRATPGWYGQPDGSMRYWDGQKWLNNTEPASQQGAGKKKGVPGWGWVLIVLGGVIMVCGVGGVLVTGLASGLVASWLTVTEVESSPAVPTPLEGGIDQGLGSQDASGDVSLGAAEVDEYTGWATVPMVITNSSEKRSNYSVDVSAESPDGATQLATTFAFVDNVEPGQTANTEATFFEELPAGTVFVIKAVERTSAVG